MSCWIQVHFPVPGIVLAGVFHHKLQQVQKAMEEEGISPESAQLSMVPKTTIPLGDKEAEQTLKLLDTLEELDDIQKAYTNADFSPEVLDKYQAEG